MAFSSSARFPPLPPSAAENAHHLRSRRANPLAFDADTKPNAAPMLENKENVGSYHHPSKSDRNSGISSRGRAVDDLFADPDSPMARTRPLIVSARRSRVVASDLNPKKEPERAPVVPLPQGETSRRRRTVVAPTFLESYKWSLTGELSGDLESFLDNVSVDGTAPSESAVLHSPQVMGLNTATLPSFGVRKEKIPADVSRSRGNGVGPKPSVVDPSTSARDGTASRMELNGARDTKAEGDTEPAAEEAVGRGTVLPTTPAKSPLPRTLGRNQLDVSRELSSSRRKSAGRAETLAVASPPSGGSTLDWDLDLTSLCTPPARGKALTAGPSGVSHGTSKTSPSLPRTETSPAVPPALEFVLEDGWDPLADLAKDDVNPFGFGSYEEVWGGKFKGEEEASRKKLPAEEKSSEPSKLPTSNPSTTSVVAKSPNPDVSPDDWFRDAHSELRLASEARIAEVHAWTASEVAKLETKRDEKRRGAEARETEVATTPTVKPFSVDGERNEECGLCCDGVVTVEIQPCGHRVCSKCADRLQLRSSGQSGGNPAGWEQSDDVRCPWDRVLVTGSEEFWFRTSLSANPVQNGVETV